MSSQGKPYRTRVLDGHEVLVGRSGDDNEYFTFQVAEPEDLWLHAGAGSAGSHVVIRNPDRAKIPREVIEKAAQLAAWFSKARNARKVPVSYCRAGNVSKPRGAPSGTVEIRGFETVVVVPSRLED